ncbi:MAG: phosphate ABC transporter permease PstA [Chitinivibrionales bacterium]|nr:phosphate ABC transporter permease PstA [Chitinivibrionales bacterium]
MAAQNIAFRKTKDGIFQGVVIALSIVSTLPLFFILYFIFKEGISSISWEFLMNLPKPVGEEGGGIANALVGTSILILLASACSLPIGIIVGIFLSEYPRSKLTYWVSLSMEVLQGIPSIVIGIIAYLWIVRPMGGFSALSGGIALGIMMLPVVVRTTEETLKLIPKNLKEASLALGAPYYLTILRVILPAGFSGIITGILVSLARIAGETAPLLFTAFGSPFMSTNIFKPMSSLPAIIFNYAISPYDDWHALAWGASFVLVAFVLLLNISAKLIAQRWSVRF